MNHWAHEHPEYEGDQYDAIVGREINVDELERNKARDHRLAQEHRLQGHAFHPACPVCEVERG